MEFLQELQAWHWLIFAFVLLGLEIIGTGGFFIGVGCAALIQAGITALFPDMSWQLQTSTYTVLAVVFTVLYWRVFKKYNEQTDNSLLNDRAAQLIGRRANLEEDVPTGQTKIQFGDTLWKAQSKQPLKKGDIVEVYGNDQMTLLIQKLDEQ